MSEHIMTEAEYDELAPEIVQFARRLREKGARGVIVHVAFGEGEDRDSGVIVQRTPGKTDDDPAFTLALIGSTCRFVGGRNAED